MAWRKSARFESSHDEYGLDLALFVHAEHQSILWWVHIEAHHITNLIDKVGILRKSEDFLAMRLQAESAPNAMNCLPRSPTRAVKERVLQCVAAYGLSSKVVRSTLSTCSSLMRRGLLPAASRLSPRFLIGQIACANSSPCARMSKAAWPPPCCSTPHWSTK